MLYRLFKLLLVGSFIFLGVADTLVAFGVIQPWGVWSAEDGEWLYNRLVHPWHALGAIVWFGVGILFSNNKS